MKYSNNIVRIGKGFNLSGPALRKRLEEEGYSGQPINWGHLKYGGLNSPESVKGSSNKRKALYTMRDAGVPVPALDNFDEFPVVGRSDHHTCGSEFWFCRDMSDVDRAKREGATHFLCFIDDAREFRVHVINGESIKISDKHKRYDPDRGFVEGKWTYPHEFKRKISLREIARDAVSALNLDFGAVDVLYKKIAQEPCFFVLEVNAAPNLTESINNDTLERWVNAFMKEYNEPANTLRHENIVRHQVRGRSSPSQDIPQLQRTNGNLPVWGAFPLSAQRSATAAWGRPQALQMSALQGYYQAQQSSQTQSNVYVQQAQQNKHWWSR